MTAPDPFRILAEVVLTDTSGPGEVFLNPRAFAEGLQEGQEGPQENPDAVLAIGPPLTGYQLWLMDRYKD